MTSLFPAQHFGEPVSDGDAALGEQVAARRHRAVHVAALPHPGGRLPRGEFTQLFTSYSHGFTSRSHSDSTTGFAAPKIQPLSLPEASKSRINQKSGSCILDLVSYSGPCMLGLVPEFWV